MPPHSPESQEPTRTPLHVRLERKTAETKAAEAAQATAEAAQATAEAAQAAAEAARIAEVQRAEREAITNELTDTLKPYEEEYLSGNLDGAYQAVMSELAKESPIPVREIPSGTTSQILWESETERDPVIEKNIKKIAENPIAVANSAYDAEKYAALLLSANGTGRRSILDEIASSSKRDMVERGGLPSVFEPRADADPENWAKEALEALRINSTNGHEPQENPSPLVNKNPENIV